MVEEHSPEELRQRSAPVRFEWGPVGGAMISEPGGCLIIVDVLSFTTSVSVATGLGTAVYPYPLGRPGAEAFAASVGAELAVPRKKTASGRPWSLSPAGLAQAPVAPRLVLPSPNGSAIAAAASGTVIAACLRNTAAIAAWVLEHGYGSTERPIAVVASGERWPDGSLRPAVEDLLGAGALLRTLHSGGRELSGEAMTVAAIYETTAHIAEVIWACGSARELISIGYSNDVEMALEVDSDRHVPVVRDGAFCV